ncbi:RagB/SusD family nutrient uptake outer membrane protein [Christiangramia sp.]|uniref:RagB/SusD family nutrient uptake outer membrane protein n=1 Tax=Christiangramia sp. TaxID=1931228 RepID=UPI0026066544|nr:RagB/SusD family nutrient uptake outer membrane protein [Christiangramia sp.]
MKTKRILRYISSFMLIGVLISCGDALEEEVFSSLGPSNFYNSADDAEALLNGVYAISQGDDFFNLVKDYLTLDEMTTDIMIARRGAINAHTQPMEDFVWSANHPYLQDFWNRFYIAIYRANIVIDEVPKIDMNEDRKEQIVAEARFLRAFNYYQLYNFFGPVPLVLTSNTSVKDRPARATEQEMRSFFEQEFSELGDSLPPAQSEYGRATSGAALGYLTKFYLNTKQWPLAAEAAMDVIDSGVHFLFQGERSELFALENEGHSEFIFVAPFPENVQEGGNNYISFAAPPGYQFQFPPKRIFSAHLKIRSEFLELFSAEDERLNAFLFEYVDQAGDLITLGEDDVRSFKYKEDPNGIAQFSGNDFPYLRYADILLSRAEALNEIEGPNEESINLMNQVRQVAGLENLTLNDFSSKERLRNFILDERGREFHTEALRRQDLIRHGKFIEYALDRGKPAAPYQVVFPIPQSEIDKNSNLEQNEGY